MLSPAGEIAVLGPGVAHLRLDLLEDVDQGGGHLDAALHREAKAVGLTRPVVGILAEDDDTHLIEGRVLKGAEDLLVGREDLMLGLLLLKEGAQLRHIGLVELLADDGEPGWVDLHFTLGHEGTSGLVET